MSKPVEISRGLYWVGVKDWNVRNFHGYTTVRGSSYNAYLITGEKNILIDTVKAPFAGKLLENISSIIDPSKLDVVISNHSEPDHSGSMPAVMAAAPGAVVIATAKGKETLENYYGGGWNLKVVKTGYSFESGEIKLDFVATPMAHWPDSMVTYWKDREILFSMDAFGQHYAAPQLFDGEVPRDVLMHEAKKYYANILMPLGKIVKKTIEALGGLKISMLAPSHGVVWKENPGGIIQSYLDWADLKPARKVLVVYDSMWGSTDAMANAIVKGAAAKGVDAFLLKLTANDMTDITTEVLDAAAVAIGSPTLNGGMLPTVSAFLTYIGGLKASGKAGAAFGSHGWGGGGAKAVEEMMDEIGFEKVSGAVTCRYKPEAETLKMCEELGAKLAEKALDAGSIQV